jgi:colanic acid biosynthesis glycosyl transferase WcaI
MSDKFRSKGSRIILLSQWFDPEPTFKGLEFAKKIEDSGFSVEVVTGFPNYPEGKIYNGYSIKPISREKVDSISVTRLALFPSHDRSKIGRFANYASFAFSVFLYLLFKVKRADLIYVYHPPLTVGIAAAAAMFFRRIPILLDVQDLWPDTLSATGMLNNKSAIWIISQLCAWVYWRASHIAVLSPGFHSLLMARGVPHEKLSTIYNWSDERSIMRPFDANPIQMGSSGQFRVLFAGNLGLAQALDTVLDAARLVQLSNAKVEFYFLGAGVDVERLAKRVCDEKISNVQFLAQVPMTEVGAYLSAADCLLVHLRADPLFSVTIPSKTQAYLAAGKPIIMAVGGDAASLIDRSSAGIVVPPEDASSLAAAVLKLAASDKEELEAMGRAAHKYYSENLSSEVGVRAFCGIFDKIIDAQTRKGRTE